ncbi:MAG: hypothetical protein JKX90_07855 [Colwellia sp.]|nr:hypothetical protein [Colwellia sp.]
MPSSIVNLLVISGFVLIAIGWTFYRLPNIKITKRVFFWDMDPYLRPLGQKIVNAGLTSVFMAFANGFIYLIMKRFELGLLDF